MNKGNFKHGEALKTKEYMAWRFMHARCKSKKRYAAHRYALRGIKVCERWGDYLNFLADIGRAPTPKHTLDRIDNDKDYEPGNVRWSTMTEQARNRSNNHYLITPSGRMTIVELSKATGIKRTTIRNRVFRGLSYEQIISAPVYGKRR